MKLLFFLEIFQVAMLVSWTQRVYVMNHVEKVLNLGAKLWSISQPPSDSTTLFDESKGFFVSWVFVAPLFSGWNVETFDPVMWCPGWKTYKYSFSIAWGLGLGKLFRQFPDICLLPQVFAKTTVFYTFFLGQGGQPFRSMFYFNPEKQPEPRFNGPKKFTN